jgi:hypothetical protein
MIIKLIVKLRAALRYNQVIKESDDAMRMKVL